jgi:hypothetical protein
MFALFGGQRVHVLIEKQFAGNGTDSSGSTGKQLGGAI